MSEKSFSVIIVKPCLPFICQKRINFFYYYFYQNIKVKNSYKKKRAAFVIAMVNKS